MKLLLRFWTFSVFQIFNHYSNSLCLRPELPLFYIIASCEIMEKLKLKLIQVIIFTKFFSVSSQIFLRFSSNLFKTFSDFYHKVLRIQDEFFRQFFLFYCPYIFFTFLFYTSFLRLVTELFVGTMFFKFYSSLPQFFSIHIFIF